MQFYDYHIHSEFSFDSSESFENVCTSAILKNVKQICFTEHFDCNYEESQRADIDRYQKMFLTMKERYGSSLDMRFGIEIGQALENLPLCQNILSSYIFDAVLMSVHNMPLKDDFYFYDFSKTNPSEVLNDYFNLLLNTAQNTDYDILTHLDYPIRFMNKNSVLRDSYRDIIAEILKTVIARNKVLEVNTGCVNKELGRTMPSWEFLRLYKDLGGNVVSTGSDAHTAHRVAANFKETYEILKLIGIKYIASFENRLLTPIVLD